MVHVYFAPFSSVGQGILLLKHQPGTLLASVLGFWQSNSSCSVLVSATARRWLYGTYTLLAVCGVVFAVAQNMPMQGMTRFKVGINA